MFELSDSVVNQIFSVVHGPNADPSINLPDGGGLLAKGRSSGIQNTLLGKDSVRVLRGPLKGLDFIEKLSAGCHAWKLLDGFEQRLQSYFTLARRFL